jgi:glutamate dehydrogenase
MRRATRWFLRHRNPQLKTIQDYLDFYQESFDDLRKNALSYVVAEERKGIEQAIDKLVKQGVPQALAAKIGILSTVFSAMDIADIVHSTGCAVRLVAESYFKLGARMQLHWFLEQINTLPVDNHWQALARAAFREELDWQQRTLTMGMLSHAEQKLAVAEILDAWFVRNTGYIDRWLQMVNDFRTTKTPEFAKFSVTLRELTLLNHNCTPMLS